MSDLMELFLVIMMIGSGIIVGLQIGGSSNISTLQACQKQCNVYQCKMVDVPVEREK